MGREEGLYKKSERSAVDAASEGVEWRGREEEGSTSEMEEEDGESNSLCG